MEPSVSMPPGISAIAQEPASSPDAGEAGLARWVAIYLFFAALILTSTQIGGRLMDWEEYRLINMVKLPFRAIFRDHSPDWGLLHFSGATMWLAYRIFNHDLLALRIPSILVSLLGLGLAYLFTRRMLRDNLAAVLVLFLLGTNWFFIDYARWALICYSGLICYSIVLTYGFWLAGEGRLGKAGRICILVISSIGVWLSFHSIPLMIVGPLTVALIHLLKMLKNGIAGRGHRKALTDLASFSPYYVLIVCVWYPFVYKPWRLISGNLDTPQVYRPDYYFKYSEFSQTILGSGLFIQQRTTDLLYWMLHPIGHVGDVATWVFVAFFWIGTIRSLIRPRIGEGRFFLAVFSLVSLATLIALGFLNAYPYGHPRYALFLLFPAATLAAAGVADVAGAIGLLVGVLAGRIIGRRVEYVLRALAMVGVCFLAALFIQREGLERLVRVDKVNRAIAALRSDAGLIITTYRYANMFYWLSPYNVKRAVLLPYDLDEKGVAQSVKNVSARLEQNPPPESIVTISQLSPSLDHEFLNLRRQIARKYETVMEIDLFEGRESFEIFHKYNVHLAMWKLKRQTLNRLRHK